MKSLLNRRLAPLVCIVAVCATSAYWAESLRGPRQIESPKIHCLSICGIRLGMAKQGVVRLFGAPPMVEKSHWHYPMNGISDITFNSQGTVSAVSGCRLTSGHIVLETVLSGRLSDTLGQLDVQPIRSTESSVCRIFDRHCMLSIRSYGDTLEDFMLVSE